LTPEPRNRLSPTLFKNYFLFCGCCAFPPEKKESNCINHAVTLTNITKNGTLKLIYTVLHQLDKEIIYPHYDFKHLTEKYFEIGMKLNDFSIQLVKYWSATVDRSFSEGSHTDIMASIILETKT
jgi:hypothetical protein